MPSVIAPSSLTVSWALVGNQPAATLEIAMVNPTSFGSVLSSQLRVVNDALSSVEAWARWRLSAYASAASCMDRGCVVRLSCLVVDHVFHI